MQLLRWKKKHEAIPIFLSLLKRLTSLDKVETTVLDLEEARSMQSALKFSCSIWDDIVITAQMKRLKIKEIYSNDKDFDNVRLVKRLFQMLRQGRLENFRAQPFFEAQANTDH